MAGNGKFYDDKGRVVQAQSTNYKGGLRIFFIVLSLFAIPMLFC